MTTKSRAIPADHISEMMYGPRAVTAPFRVIASQRTTVRGIPRTLLGGIVLGNMCQSDQWERWQGTVVLVPSKIELCIPPAHYDLQTMMLNFLGHGSDPDDEDHNMWRTSWEAPK